MAYSYASQSRVAVSTGNAESNKLVREVFPGLSRIEPDVSPLTALLTLSEKSVRTVKNPTFRHWEQRDFARTLTCTGTHNTSVTTINVSDSDPAYVRHTAVNTRTREMLLITAIPGTTSLTVTRTVGTVARAAMNSGDTLLLLGTALTEGGSSQEANNVTYTEAFNNVQKLETCFEVTDFTDMSEWYSGNEYDNRQKDAFCQHKRDIEHMLWYGQRAVLNSTGNTPTYLSQGFFNYLSSNSFDMSGSITEDTFEQTVLEAAFRYGSKKKWLFAPARLISIIDSWGRDRLRQADGMSKALGLEVKEYITTHGTLMVVRHYLFEGGGSASRAPQRRAAILDPANIRMAVMARGKNFSYGGKTYLEEDIQLPDEYLRKGRYVSMLGLDLMLEETHSEIYNFF